MHRKTVMGTPSTQATTSSDQPKKARDPKKEFPNTESVTTSNASPRGKSEVPIAQQSKAGALGEGEVQSDQGKARVGSPLEQTATTSTTTTASAGSGLTTMIGEDTFDFLLEDEPTSDTPESGTQTVSSSAGQETKGANVASATSTRGSTSAAAGTGLAAPAANPGGLSDAEIKKIKDGIEREKDKLREKPTFANKPALLDRAGENVFNRIIEELEAGHNVDLTLTIASVTDEALKLFMNQQHGVTLSYSEAQKFFG